MALESSAWTGPVSRGSDYFIIDAASRKIVNAIDLTGGGDRPRYGGAGLHYDETRDVDPRIGTRRIRIRCEGSRTWIDEFYRLEDDMIHWQPANSPRSHPWKRVRFDGLPEPVRRQFRHVLARMNQ